MPEETNGVAAAIAEGRTALGIELGSTRIKAVLTGPDHRPIASGSHDWENRYVDGSWTYSLDDVWSGLQGCYSALAADVQSHYGLPLNTVGALGISAMMHGYLAFDSGGALLTPFRTWRNTNTGPAVQQLSERLGCNIPHRWSVAHLYQAILDGEEHVPRVSFFTTLAGYVHWRLTGRQVLGVGDASGMFPIDPASRRYDQGMMATFDRMASEHGTPMTLVDLLPEVLTAGEPAGELSDDGARLLDPGGTLQPGVLLCPPEGDAGTGMVATGSIAPRTGNVSAGTSIFAMVVLEHPLRRVHRELDMVTTPVGDPVAMVHCNNGASELDAWAGLFAELARRIGSDADKRVVFDTLVRSALDGAPDGGGLLAYNYLSGEPITDVEHGRPLFLRTPDSTLDLPTFMRVQMYSALATLRIGIHVLQHDEQVELERMFAHGGLFTTGGVAQGFLAAAIDTPVTVGDIAAEGGPWGIALLAAYRGRADSGISLAEFLDRDVFATARLDTLDPRPEDVAGFAAFMERYRAGLPVTSSAGAHT